MSVDGISNRVVYFQGGQQANSVDASPAAKHFPEINEIETHRDNLMADNFFDPNKEKATYHTVMLESFRTREVAKAKRAAVISILAAEIPVIDYVSKNSSEYNNTAFISEGYYSQVNQAEITESSEDYLKSEREKLEEAAQGTPDSGSAESSSAQAAAASDSYPASTPAAAAAPVDVTV